MLSDLRLALRSLSKSPGFTAVALLTLALGIGFNSAMFNIVNSLALQPLPFPDSARLFRLERASPQQGNGGHRPGHFPEIAAASLEFADLACSRPWSFALAEGDRPPEVLAAARVSAGYFRVLGLNMELGRAFSTEEDQPGRSQVVILSHSLWVSRFNADPAVIGRTVRLDGQPNEIVGVASPLARDSRTIGTPELYRPLALTPGDLVERVDHAFDIIGRYRDGISVAEAAARFVAVSTSLAASDPTEYEGRQLRAVSLQPKLQGTGRQMIFLSIGLSGFVLLIACANLANLLLTRALARTREFAVRGALGATRLQLIRPLAAECMLLAGVGGALGLLVCSWTNAWMAREFAAAGTDFTFAADWRLLSYALGLSTVTGLFFGTVPAWILSRVSVNDALKSGGRGATGDRSQTRLRQILVAGQIALALMLLSGAAFFVRGFEHILTRDAGWNTSQLLRGILVVPETRYPDPAAMMRLYDQVLAQVTAVPGVEAAAICYDVPAFGFKSGHGFIIEGQTPPAPGQELGAPINGVTPGYFNTLGTRLVQGRDFAPTDRADSPRVIILNETMARKLFPAGDAVGRRVAYSDDKVPVWIEIIGIVEDVRPLNFGSTAAMFQTYIPLAQATWSYVALCVRSSVPPATLGDTIRRTVAALDPDLPVKELAPVADFISRNLQDFQAIIRLLVGFAVLGLFLAALGIYAVIARLVAQRTHEIGIRMALGAQVGQIARLILGSGLRLVLIGTALGLVGAIALVQVLASATPGLATSNLPSVAAASVLLVSIALLACWLPARRASKVDPMVALRAE